MGQWWENESQPYSLNGEKNSKAAFVLLDGHCPVQVTLCSGARLCDAGRAALRDNDTLHSPQRAAAAHSAMAACASSL